MIGILYFIIIDNFDRFLAEWLVNPLLSMPLSVGMWLIEGTKSCRDL
jgi:hypothetical protein